MLLKSNRKAEAVATAIERSGDSVAIASLDEKVKECGRLIVRMGTELMEETKRRQALEAEVHLAAQAKQSRAEQHSRPIPLTHTTPFLPPHPHPPYRCRSSV